MKGDRAADELYVQHILDAGELIVGYVRSVTQEAFMLDRLRLDGVIRNFQVMGEAAKRISASLREASPDVPWREFAGFRDVLVHRYDEIIASEVWEVATEDLPRAVEALRRMRERAGGRS